MSSALTMLRNAAVAGLLVAAVAGCDQSAQQGAAPAAKTSPPVEVGVFTVEARRLPVSIELPGRIAAFRVAEIRPQVDGIIRERLFREGGEVVAGQPLYQIDPKPYQAKLASAQAALQKAKADVAATSAKAGRYRELVAQNAVSRQNYDDAVAAQKEAEADAAAAQAAIDAAQINLGYTTVVSPISGRIGKSTVSEGALVTANQVTALSVVQQLDPIYADLTQSLEQLSQLRRDIAAGSVASAGNTNPAVTLVLGNEGRLYGEIGELLFSDITVETDTNTVQLRALVPNPREELLPGMFVRGRVDQGIRENAILVPQQAVVRDSGGHPQIWLVDAEGQVAPHPIQTDRAVGNAWLVTDGLKPGDRIVAEGLQKIRSGTKVSAVPTTVRMSIDADARAGQPSAAKP